MPTQLPFSRAHSGAAAIKPCAARVYQKTVRHYMMRWNAKNERRSTTEEMYDDLSPENTINASSMI